MTKAKNKELIKGISKENIISAAQLIEGLYNYSSSVTKNSKTSLILDGVSSSLVAAVAREKDSIIIAFRGAQGVQENISCMYTGKGEIHKGFQDSYNNIKKSICEYVTSSLTTTSIIVTGHSRGTGFVPQLVEDLLILGVPINNLRAISFSPLPVYSPTKAKSYNERFGTDYHLNILASEDSILSYLKPLQKLYTWLHCSKQDYCIVGSPPITYTSESSGEFNNWVQKTPYVHAVFPWVMSWFISSKSWGAHMPEGYLYGVQDCLDYGEKSDEKDSRSLVGEQSSTEELS